MMINGEESLRVLTTAEGVVPRLVKKTPGVGKPYWYWPSIPAGQVIAADFTDAPVATSDEAQNAADIAAITATPQEKLTYG
ncbi:hypothetical protein DNX69_10910 [Rhodopseudomonas palustris]|uniref:Uncharacterized protein n=2 Tax=Rhodopseudomonas palustris TaxID=1076 RepID=A0A323UN21_RHOPL|nr:hypothetical protein DNX69_10910 [Rhodopseudomonas palustris]